MNQKNKPGFQIILSIVIGVPLLMLRAFIAFKICQWYNLPFKFNILEWVALGFLISLFTVEFNGKPDTETDKEYFTKLMKHALYLIILLIVVSIIRIV